MELKEMRDLDKEQLLGKLETSKQDLFNLRRLNNNNTLIVRLKEIYHNS